MTFPEWMLERLRADNPDGVTRNAREGRCADCGRRVLRGLDADRCGVAVTVDAQEIDLHGERVALIANLRTYTLSRVTTSAGAARWQLDPRDPTAIRAGQRTPIVAAHRCDVVLPRARRSHLPSWMHRTPVTTDAPPF